VVLGPSASVARAFPVPDTLTIRQKTSRTTLKPLWSFVNRSQEFLPNAFKVHKVRCSQHPRTWVAKVVIQSALGREATL